MEVFKLIWNKQKKGSVQIILGTEEYILIIHFLSYNTAGQSHCRHILQAAKPKRW